MRKTIIAAAVAVILLGCQIGLALTVRDLKPSYPLLEPPPQKLAMAAMMMGDKEFFFRANSLRIQHAGNLGGDIIPLMQMNYQRLAAWFQLLDTVNANSDVVPHMAAYLFSSTQTTQDVIPMIDYLANHARRDPVHKWRWMAQATMLARYRVQDYTRAEKLADELARISVPDMPPWTKQLRVFIRMDMGDKEGAMTLLEYIICSDPSMNETEKRWANFYVKQHFGQDAVITC